VTFLPVLRHLFTFMAVRLPALVTGERSRFLYKME
jgi:hypothetical protein